MQTLTRIPLVTTHILSEDVVYALGRKMFYIQDLMKLCFFMKQVSTALLKIPEYCSLDDMLRLLRYTEHCTVHIGNLVQVELAITVVAYAR
jgi:hypothetical protein